jgi:hypothetical protein
MVQSLKVARVAESPFMPLDFAIVPRRCRSIHVVSGVLSNAIIEPRVSSMETVDPAQVVQDSAFAAAGGL